MALESKTCNTSGLCEERIVLGDRKPAGNQIEEENRSERNNNGQDTSVIYTELGRS